MSDGVESFEVGRESNPPAHRSSRSFFISQDVSDKAWYYLVKAMKSKRVQRKLKGEHLDVVSDHAWIFQFIDIIYVGTITEISRIIEQCGTGPDVYMLCVAYFVIMFNTRAAFDVYACISGAKGIALIIAFALYGIGVFIMTINIAVNQSEEEQETDEAAVVYSYSNQSSTLGSEHCMISYDYNIAFASAFLFTRVNLIIMYFLYFKVFHEVNITGLAPAWGTDTQGNPVYASDLDSAQVETALRAAAARNPDLTTDAGTSRVSEATRSHILRHSSIRAMEGLGKSSSISQHFSHILLLKVGPLVVSSVVMILLLVQRLNHISVLVAVATVEFLGDFLPSFFIRSKAEWKELSVHKHFAQERLGLYFMLVMGEAVLGFSSVQSHNGGPKPVYYFLIFAFITIFSLGLQFFEQLQAYTKPEGQHPLDVKQLSPVYTWLVCLTCFFMLLASNGMAELFADVANHAEHALSTSHRLYQKQKIANGVGSVMILTVVLKMLDKVYYREQLLPPVVFDWLEQFYEHPNKAAKAGNHHSGNGRTAPVPTDSSPVVTPPRAPKRSFGLTWKDVFRCFCGWTEPEEVPNEVLHADGTVAYHNVSFGIRRIRPLTILRICLSAVMFACKHWSRKMPTENFMATIAIMVGIPNLVEAVVELRNFVNKHQNERSDSVHSETRSPISGGDDGIPMNNLSSNGEVARDTLRRSSIEEEQKPV